MIVGLLQDVSTFDGILPAAMRRAIKALRQVDPLRLAAGRHELEGDDIFYVVQDPVPSSKDKVKVEKHFCYADIHVPLSRRERYGFSLPDAALATLDEPVAGGDVAFYTTPRNEYFFDLEPGSFVVFLPHELHRSCLLIDDKTPFRKLVIKVHSRLFGLPSDPALMP